MLVVIFDQYQRVRPTVHCTPLLRILQLLFHRHNCWRWTPLLAAPVAGVKCTVRHVPVSCRRDLANSDVNTDKNPRGAAMNAQGLIVQWQTPLAKWKCKLLAHECSRIHPKFS